jgi:hypothetical protein
MKTSKTGGPIRRFPTAISRIYIACAQAASIGSEQFPPEIFEILEKLAGSMDKAREAHERSATEEEREHVSEGVNLYRQVLGKIEELGLDEPQTLTVTFNNLVRRHNDLNPGRDQGHHR